MGLASFFLKLLFEITYHIQHFKSLYTDYYAESSSVMQVVWISER